MDEYELLRRYSDRGDEAAFAAIVDRYLGKLYGVAYRRTGDRLLSEEIAQDVFTALAKKAPSMDANTVLACWLHRATALRSAHALRSEYRRQRKMRSLSEANLEGPDATPKVEDDLLSILDQAVDQLDEQDRKLVLLRYFDDLTFREIANRLGISKSAAHRDADRALEKLSTLLKRWNVVMPASALAATLASEFAQAAPASLLSSAIVKSAIKSAAIIPTSTSLLIMTKTSILTAVGGLLVALSTMGGVQLGKTQARSRREAAIERAALLVATSETKTANPQTNEDRLTTLAADGRAANKDPLAQIIAQILERANDDAFDPKDAEFQAVLAKIDEHELPEAMGYMDVQTDARNRSLLGGMLLMRWSQVNGADAAKALFSHAEPSDLNWYAMVVAVTWSEAEPRAALAWQRSEDVVERLAHGTRRQMLREVFKAWAARDRDEALAALEELTYDEQKAAVWAFGSNSGETQKILQQIGGGE